MIWAFCVCVCVLVPLQLFAWFSLILRSQAHIPAERSFFWDANLTNFSQPTGSTKQSQRGYHWIIGGFLVVFWGLFFGLRHLFSRLDLSLVAKLNKELLVVLNS